MYTSQLIVSLPEDVIFLTKSYDLFNVYVLLIENQ